MWFGSLLFFAYEQFKRSAPIIPLTLLGGRNPIYAKLPKFNLLLNLAVKKHFGELVRHSINGIDNRT